MKRLATRYGPWALITGAAQGLGAEFARQCAGAGLKLLLVDRLRGQLVEQASAIAERSGVEVRTVVADLGRPGFLEVIEEAADDIDVGLLVASAALAPVGWFLDAPAAEHARVLDVNARAPLLLVHAMGRKMAARGRGGVILVSSASALSGAGSVACYAATKAFSLVLAESLWWELRPAGVDVLAVMPGLTKTPGMLAKRPDLRHASVHVARVGPTVTEALGALGRRPSVVLGRPNQLAFDLLTRLLPRAAAIELVSRTTARIFRKRLER